MTNLSLLSLLSAGDRDEKQVALSLRNSEIGRWESVINSVKYAQVADNTSPSGEINPVMHLLTVQAFKTVKRRFATGLIELNQVLPGFQRPREIRKLHR